MSVVPDNIYLHLLLSYFLYTRSPFCYEENPQCLNPHRFSVSNDQFLYETQPGLRREPNSKYHM